MPSRDPVFELADAFVLDFARLSPMQATMTGISGVHDGWDDLSPEGAARTAEALRTWRTRFEALPPAAGPWERVARRVAREFLDDRLSHHDHGDHFGDLNNIESPFQHLKLTFELMDASTREGATAVARRLETIDQPLAGYRATLEIGIARGQAVARRQVLAAIEQAKVLASDRSSLTELPLAVAKADLGDPALTSRVEAGVATARVAFGRFGEWLQASYLPHATERESVGAARYARASKRFLGEDIDLRETYAWGWQEIARIEAAMREVAERITPGASVREVVERLRTDPTCAAGGLEPFLVQMRDLQLRALTDLDGTHFDVPAPIRDIDVKAAQPGTALGAYYIPPSDGFKRIGTVYYVAGDDTSYPLFEEITTAYHEGFPGHHLQCSLQVHFADRLTTLHRLLVCMSGYAEGWALYAERLMHELGYLDRPEYELGMLLASLFRACRIVIDIGAHLELPIPEGLPAEVTAPGSAGDTWTYDLAKAFLQHHAMTRPDFAASEITRYLGWPGQAISYKVGERILLDLREEARAALGDRFDLKAFHTAVLSTGSVGLGLLREVVREEMGFAG